MSWTEGAELRIRDAFYASDPPTFAGGQRADPIAVVESIALLGHAGQAVELNWSLSALDDLAELSALERLSLADEYVAVRPSLAPSDVDHLSQLVGELDWTQESDVYVLAIADRLRDAAGLALEADAPCPTAAEVASDLYRAGAVADRVATRGASCPAIGIDLEVEELPDGLTAELIETVRALRALATVGAISSDAVAQYSARLVEAVEVAVSSEPASRSLLQLLSRASGADAAAAAAITAGATDVIAASERTLRWLGSLPDDASGVDLHALLLALRSVSLIDREAAESVAEQMLLASDDRAYRFAVEQAIGGSISADDADAIEALPQLLELPLSAQVMDCDVLQALLPGGQASVPSGEAGLDGVLTAIAARCSLEPPPEEAGATDSVARLVREAAAECTGTREPSPATVRAAQRVVADLDWSWSDRTVPTFTEIAERMTVLELGEGSCAGFWWADRT